MWIAWAVISIPLALMAGGSWNDSAAWQAAFDAEMNAKTAAYDAAYQRIWGEGRNEAIRRATTPEALSAASAQSLAQYQQIVSNPDDALREQIARIEQQYQPLQQRLIAEQIRTLRLLVLIVWVSLAGGSYAIGATVAWIRRGFEGPDA